MEMLLVEPQSTYLVNVNKCDVFVSTYRHGGGLAGLCGCDNDWMPLQYCV